MRTIIARTRDRLRLSPERLAADTAYGSGEMLGLLVCEAMEPHIPTFDKWSAGTAPSPMPSSDVTWKKASMPALVATP